MTHQLTEKVRDAALANGADLVGITHVCELPEHSESIQRVVPEAKSIVVVVSRHGIAAIRSEVNEVAQFDTIHTYNECVRAAHQASRLLESDGFPSVSVPAFIPLDMRDPKKGMRGEISWRTAAVRAGLGSFGENGLLVTRQFGSAVRIAGLLTTADLAIDSPLEEDVCDHCMRCVVACPVNALEGAGKTNKKQCGDNVFRFGFRSFQALMQGLMQEPTAEIREAVAGHTLRELWQTFMTGNYYYCFACQAECEMGRTQGRRG